MFLSTILWLSGSRPFTVWARISCTLSFSHLSFRTFSAASQASRFFLSSTCSLSSSTFFYFSDCCYRSRAFSVVNSTASCNPFLSSSNASIICTYFSIRAAISFLTCSAYSPPWDLASSTALLRSSLSLLLIS